MVVTSCDKRRRANIRKSVTKQPDTGSVTNIRTYIGNRWWIWSTHTRAHTHNGIALSTRRSGYVCDYLTYRRHHVLCHVHNGCTRVARGGRGWYQYLLGYQILLLCYSVLLLRYQDSLPVGYNDSWLPWLI